MKKEKLKKRVIEDLKKLSPKYPKNPNISPLIFGTGERDKLREIDKKRADIELIINLVKSL